MEKYNYNIEWFRYLWHHFKINSIKCRMQFKAYLNIYFRSFYWFKGSRQRERRGFGKVSNICNMSRTAAIDVLFSFNFTVVFDFIYFRFHPSKAKWIATVLTNRRNPAIRSMFFFSFILSIAYWRTESFCFIRQFLSLFTFLTPLFLVTNYL